MKFIYMAVMGWMGLWGEENQDRSKDVPMEDEVCLSHVNQLPTQELFEGHDPRLKGERLMVILKSKRQLVLFEKGHRYQKDGVTGCWRVALGVGEETGVYPSGPKRVEGDRKTPEGWYRTSDKPTSQYYKAIAIHYPGLMDAEYGLAQGMITQKQVMALKQALEGDEKPKQNSPLGGEILIHGGGSIADWTFGCIAMENEDLDALRDILPPNIKTDVLILP
jgi:murein L,D-transpeptidase YafK